MSGRKTLRLGLVGCGVVGGGVVETLLGRDRPWEAMGLRLELVRVADVKWPAGSPAPKRLRTRRVAEILEDPRLDTVVELVGGTAFAFDLVRDALRNGKHVVTANKALLAERGAPLFRLAAQQGREIAFEAAVAGGLPILEAVQSGLAANRFTAVYGILNGTTNFILSRMSERGLAYAEALAEAQRLGFAEADPRLDVEGIDAAHKLKLLAALALGADVEMRRIPVRGLTRVSLLDLAYARQLGCRVKLIAAAMRREHGLEIRVAPTLVPRAHPLASVENETNAVCVEGTLTGGTVFVGKGAGRYPTASAVLSDLIRLARGASPDYVRRMTAARPTLPAPAKHRRSRFYLRLSALERPGVLAQVTRVLGDAAISIASVVQLESAASAFVPIALLTHETTEARINRAVERINRLSVIKARTVVFPFVE